MPLVHNDCGCTAASQRRVVRPAVCSSQHPFGVTLLIPNALRGQLIGVSSSRKKTVEARTLCSISLTEQVPPPHPSFSHFPPARSPH